MRLTKYSVWLLSYHYRMSASAYTSVRNVFLAKDFCHLLHHHSGCPDWPHQTFFSSDVFCFIWTGERPLFSRLPGDVRRHPDSPSVFATGRSGALCGHSLPPERRYSSLINAAFHVPAFHTQLPSGVLLRNGYLVFYTCLRPFRFDISCLSCLMSGHVSHLVAPSLASPVCVLHSPPLIGSPYKELFRAVVRDGRCSEVTGRGVCVHIWRER